MQITDANMQTREIRLPEYEYTAICKLFRQFLRKDDRLWPFGSRAYPEKRGGDIDLYIETNMESAKEIARAEMAFLV